MPAIYRPIGDRKIRLTTGQATVRLADAKISDTMDRMRPLRILHSVNHWLSQTEPWIPDQIDFSGLPARIIANRYRPQAPRHPDLRGHRIPPRLLQLIRSLAYGQGLGDPLRAISLVDPRWRTLLFSHYGVTGVLDLPLNAPLHVVRFYGYDLTPAALPRQISSLYPELFQRVQAFLVEGPFMAKRLCQLGCPREKVHVHHLGVPLQSGFSLRRWRQGPLRCLVAGTFVEKKGIVESLELLATARKDLGIDVRIELVGDVNPNIPPSKRCQKRILQCMERYGMRAWTRHHGFVSRQALQAIARECHLGLFLSRWDESGQSEGGYPVTMVELMGDGLPVLATDHCDLPEVVGRTGGWICHENDPGSALTALQSICQVPEELEHRSLGARRRVVNDFCRQRQGLRLGHFLRSLAHAF